MLIGGNDVLMWISSQCSATLSPSDRAGVEIPGSEQHDVFRTLLDNPVPISVPSSTKMPADGLQLSLSKHLLGVGQGHGCHICQKSAVCATQGRVGLGAGERPVRTGAQPCVILGAVRLCYVKAVAACESTPGKGAKQHATVQDSLFCKEDSTRLHAWTILKPAYVAECVCVHVRVSSEAEEKAAGLQTVENSSCYSTVLVAYRDKRFSEWSR